MSFPITVSKLGQALVNRVQPIGWTILETWQWCWEQDDAETLGIDNSMSPRNWYAGGPLSCGIRRGIMFFDTTGISQDVMLRLYVRDAGFGAAQLYVLNGNGADYDFGDEIYGWIRGRFSSEYLIATRDFTALTLYSYQYFLIPAAHINSSGYTVLILTSSSDYGYVGAPACGCSFDINLVALTLSSAGYIWIEGTSVAYIDASEAKRTQEGTLDGATGQTAGHIWIEGDNFRYIDSSGNERYIAGSAGAASSQTAGHIWFEGSELHYIDSSGNERYFEGS